MKKNARKILSSFAEEYSSLQKNQKFYFNALLFFVLAIFSIPLPLKEYTRSLFLIFAVFWLCAIYLDAAKIYRVIYSSFIGKGLTLILLTLSTNFSLALAAEVVNSVTGTNPSAFPYTIAFISVLIIPLLIVIALGGIYLVLVVFAPLMLAFYCLPDERAKAFIFPGHERIKLAKYNHTTRIVQVVSAVFLCGLVFGFSKDVRPSYEKFVTKSTNWFLFNLEMYPRSNCLKKHNEKIAFLEGGRVLIGTESSVGTYKYIVRECNR